LPEEAQGKRVIVELAGGQVHGEKPAGDAGAGWAADGRGGLRWSLTGDPHDVAWWRPA
jgi:hypothetical protein